jgi:hypothetical protein
MARMGVAKKGPAGFAAGLELGIAQEGKPIGGAGSNRGTQGGADLPITPI